jgi:hypothetical protein
MLLSVELPKEGPQVLPDDAVKHPMLRGATHVRPRVLQIGIVGRWRPLVEPVTR